MGEAERGEARALGQRGGEWNVMPPADAQPSQSRRVEHLIRTMLLVLAGGRVNSRINEKPTLKQVQTFFKNKWNV